MESVYVMTRRPIWREMTRFWGILFGINFAMGVATGITMEFQFGTNWAYYSQYVGDIFGRAPGARRADGVLSRSDLRRPVLPGAGTRMSQLGHLAVTWLVAIGSNLSALWILIANGWMQNPVGAAFNPATCGMELTSFYDLVFNPVAQDKFVHTVSAGYVTGSIFMLSVSAYYLLRGRHVALARRSLTVAASFGLASALSVVVLGDESGYTATLDQKMKIAAIEAMWQTELAPGRASPCSACPIRRRARRSTRSKSRGCWGLSPRARSTRRSRASQSWWRRARSASPTVSSPIARCRPARQNPDDPEAKAALKAAEKDLGYALLLRRYTADIAGASPAQINAAAGDLVPDVPVLFWGFRVMAGLGFYFILLFAGAFYLASTRRLDRRWFLRIAMLSLPLPWVAAELGWVVAEYGRQPWVVEGVMPTFLGVSSVSVATILGSLTGFVLFYSALAAADLALMVRTIRRGPAG